MAKIATVSMGWLLAWSVAIGCGDESGLGSGGPTGQPLGGAAAPTATPEAAASAARGGVTPGKAGVTPEQGATEFMSADTRGGFGPYSAGPAFGAGGAGAVSTPTAVAPAAPGQVGEMAATGVIAADPRAVERGDIYRVLGDGRILNLNRYRGLQIIDLDSS